MDVTLHPTPRGRDVVLEQVRITGLRLRREMLAVGVVLGIVTIVIAIDVARGSAATWFDSKDWFPLGFLSGLASFAIWRGERRFGPAFLWTLPVDRRRLALARVLAGWVWVMAALAFFVSWQLVLVLVSGLPGARTVTPFVFAGATGMYLLGSALVLGLRHPLRWLLGTVAVFFLLGYLNQSVGGGPDGRLDALLSSTALFSAMQHAERVWQTLPPLAQSAIAAFLWLAGGLVALWPAVSRHGERRRH